MTLRLYDFEFNLLAAEPKVIKSKWTVYYNGIGSFEAHLPLTSEMVGIVMDNRYLVAVQSGFSAVIVGKELRDELIIYGRTCNWLLTKRITPAVEKLSKAAGEMAGELAIAAFADVDNFALGSIAEGSSVEFECGESTVSNAVIDCLNLGELGHSVDFDVKNQQWIFNVSEGQENELIISEGLKNAYDTKLSSDILDLATCGNFNLQTDDGAVSTYIEGDSDKTGIYRWEAQLYGSTETEAALCLAKQTEKNETVVKVRNIAFGTDYNLGDIVRIQIIKGVYRTTVKKRIIGVETCFEHGTGSEQPVFGDVS